MGIRRLLKFSEVFGACRCIPEYMLDAFSQGTTCAKSALTNAPLTLRRGTSDWRVYRKVFIEKEYDLDYSTNFDLIIDAGANAGYATVFYAKNFPSAKIIAIEPDHSNFMLLKKNTQHLSNVECLYGALWHQKTSISIANPNAPKWAFQIGESSSQSNTVVPAFTMDELLDRHPQSKVLFKCDIEGAETPVFQHSTSWITKIDAIICELHDRIDPNSSRAFHIATRDFSRHFFHGENNVVLR